MSEQCEQHMRSACEQHMRSACAHGCDAECHVTERDGTERKSVQDPASNPLVPDAAGAVDNRWMVADEMFRDFLQSHSEQRRNSYRRRMLLRERTDLRHPIDRKIHELRRYDAETETLRQQIRAVHVG